MLADVTWAPQSAPTEAGRHHLTFCGNSQTVSPALKGFTGIVWNAFICSKRFYTSPVFPFPDRIWQNGCSAAKTKKKKMVSLQQISPLTSTKTPGNTFHKSHSRNSNNYRVKSNLKLPLWMCLCLFYINWLLWELRICSHSHTEIWNKCANSLAKGFLLWALQYETLNNYWNRHCNNLVINIICNLYKNTYLHY